MVQLGSAAVIIIVIISSTYADPNCVCPRNYAPVCGTDGQVYSNRCLLDCTKSMLRSDLEVATQGPCRPIRPQCECARILSPVCGSDGVTYNNVCLLRCERSKQPELEVEYKGTCGKRAKRSSLYQMRYNMHRRYPCSTF